MITVWQCPDCKTSQRTSVAGMADGGTPFCPDCQCHCDYSHSLVKRPSLRHIVFTRHGDGFMAKIGKSVWGTGGSRSCALGDVVRSHQELFGVIVSEGA